MIRFAVIGTNWITERFIDAAHATGKLRLSAVYSRDIEKAREFGQPYQAQFFFDDLKALANSPNIDAVYIASPNSLHYQQALLMIQHDKHVICEKPMTSHIQELESLIAHAQKHQVVLFEAFKTAYLPNFSAIEEALPRLGQIRKAFIHYCQYSSRYQRYLNGENPNTFNPHFSNGSIMDIGYYCLASALALFGEPNGLDASATLLKSGVDGQGTVWMSYDDFDVVLFHSKISDSYIPCEIQGEEGSIIIEHISQCTKVTFMPRGGVPEDISRPQHENTMYYEAEVFADLINSQTINHSGLALSRSTSRLLTDIRALTGVVFPADKATMHKH